MQSLQCRICSTTCSASHCTRLFTPAGTRDKWAKRTAELLQVPVTRGDGLPAQICGACSSKILSIESSMKTLNRMRLLANDAYLRVRSVDPSKRPKNTSCVDVSPHTAMARPSAKRRPLTPRQLLFNDDTESGEILFTCMWLLITILLIF